MGNLPCGGSPRRPLSRRLLSSRPQAVAPRPLWRLPPPASVASSLVFTAPGSGSPSPMEVAPAGLCRVVSCLHGPRQWLPVPCGGCPRRPLSRRLLSSQPQAVAPRPLWRLPPPASVASPLVFTAPGSGSTSPVEVAPACLYRVVVSSILLGPRQ